MEFPARSKTELEKTRTAPAIARTQSPFQNRTWNWKTALTPLALRRFLLGCFLLGRFLGFLACLLRFRLLPSRGLLRRLRRPRGRRAGRSCRSRLALIFVRLFLNRNLFYLDRAAQGLLALFFFLFEPGQFVVFLIVRFRIEHGTSLDGFQDCRTALAP